MAQKKALVTGASEGIGRAFALKLAEQGYQVIAVARNEARLQALVEEMGGTPHSYRVLDLVTPHGIQALAEEIPKLRLELLVNNAGSGVYGKFHEVDLPAMQTVLRLNCEALVTLSHAFLKTARAGDALINVSSVLAMVPMPSSALYSATKAFVTSLSDSLWFENRARQIYVVGLCPGSTETEFHTRAGGSREVRPPAALTQTPDQVVKVALKALRRRKIPTVVSGWKNRFFLLCSKFMSRKAVVSFMGRGRA
ncbi:MAG: SDR family NAD(P)-dependent oxidoreductase [Bdellovibrionales bacterium]|nr:SDR family NAD(P)-dependent oxidoreductase [Bdellovibrionales bacterium]